MERLRTSCRILVTTTVFITSWVDVNEELKFLCKFKKNIFFFLGGGGVGGRGRGGGSISGGQGGCESRIEVFWKIQKKIIFFLGGRGGPWGGRVGGSGWMSTKN